MSLVAIAIITRFSIQNSISSNFGSPGGPHQHGTTAAWPTI
jgi:hypothetical protein